MGSSSGTHISGDDACRRAEWALDALPIAVFMVDREYRYLTFNRAHADEMRAGYGTSIEEGGSALDAQTVPGDRDATRSHLDRALAGETHTVALWSGEPRKRRYELTTYTPIPGGDGDAIVGVAVASLDATENALLARRSRHLAAIVDSSDDAIVGSTLDGTITVWNHGAERLYGYGADEARGENIAIIAPVDRFDEIPSILRRIRSDSHIEHAVTRTRRKDGSEIEAYLTVSPVLDGDGRVVAASVIARDLTAQRLEKALHAELEHRALHDELTGLWNRRGLETLAERMIAQAERTRQSLGLLFVDINNMKTINDELGHVQGDQAIRDLAQLLNKQLRSADLVARYGGDEFVVLSVGVTPTGLAKVRQRLDDELREFQQSESRPYRLSAAVGMDFCEAGSACHLGELVASADASMYAEKRH